MSRDLTSEVMAFGRASYHARAMDAHVVPFGVHLRRWRERRRMTQIDLAVAAASSTRHLSCLETGKARPSREMVIRLTEYLDIPLRDRNTLLLAAGYAPAFGERSLDGLDAAKSAIETASKSLRDLRVAEVVQQDLHIEDGGEIIFRSKLRLSFKYEDPA